jgi:hypothetical protein
MGQGFMDGLAPTKTLFSISYGSADECRRDYLRARRTPESNPGISVLADTRPDVGHDGVGDIDRP